MSNFLGSVQKRAEVFCCLLIREVVSCADKKPAFRISHVSVRKKRYKAAKAELPDGFGALRFLSALRHSYTKASCPMICLCRGQGVYQMYQESQQNHAVVHGTLAVAVAVLAVGGKLLLQGGDGGFGQVVGADHRHVVIWVGGQ